MAVISVLQNSLPWLGGKVKNTGPLQPTSVFPPRTFQGPTSPSGPSVVPQQTATILGLTERVMSTNPAYHMTIWSSRYNTSVVALLPDKIILNIGSEWESLISSPGGALADKFMQEITGYSARVQELSGLVWSGSQPIAFEIPLEFIAETSGKYDVMAPISALARMVLPTTRSVATSGLPFASQLNSYGQRMGLAANRSMNFMIPPGPRVFNNTRFTDQDIITVICGNFLVLSGIIIPNIMITTDGRLGSDGFPMMATVKVSIRTFTAPIGADIDGMFGVPAKG